MKAYDSIVVGGGIIGAATAFELAQKGLSVVLLDRQEPGLEASWAAAGMLSTAPDAPEAAPLVSFARESHKLYPEFISAIERASGTPVEFHQCGALEIFLAPHGGTDRDERVAEIRRHGISAEPISLSEALRKEPMLNPVAQAVAWIPEEAYVSPRELTQAMLAAATNSGVEIRAGSEVISILTGHNGCEGVLAADSTTMKAGRINVSAGEKIHAKKTIIAAGCFSGTIGWMERYAPTHPVRGQMVAMRNHGGVLRCILRCEDGYLVPRKDGRVVAGSTLENAGFEKQVTPGGLGRILKAAIDLAPELENAAIGETWSGLRPDTPDHLPIIGPTDIDGLFIATGHYRNGILLAPATAKCISEWIREGKSSINVENFSPMRFAAATHGAKSQC
ncbi:MAG TPA: glycine oxidase ThiO [Candidatus Acidoferrales bacterium]|nr:glycine oxidase ThiO [Candidatus Acidoferrales bacterium]